MSGAPRRRSSVDPRAGRRSGSSPRSPCSAALGDGPRAATPCTAPRGWRSSMIALAFLYIFAGRAVPRHRPDRRLHRRRDDAVPLRADARRCRHRATRSSRRCAANGLRRSSPGSGFGLLADHRARSSEPRSPQRARRGERRARQQRPGASRCCIFSRYVCAFEITSALLITAALGAMVLAHRERLVPRADQRELSERVRARLAADAAARPRRLRAAQRGRHPGPAAGRLTVPGSRPGILPARPGGARTRRRRVLDATASAEELVPARAETSSGEARREPHAYLVVSALLFTIGAAGVLLRRNAIVVFMCIELMLNASTSRS